MNVLKNDIQEMIFNLLVEGNTIRGIERITGVHRDTIMRLTARVGEKCRRDMAEKFRELNCQNIEADEIWTFVGKKKKRLRPEEKKSELGDQYVYIALDRDTKLVPVFLVGKRDTFTTYLFVRQLRKRVTNHFQLTTDQFNAYKDIVRSVCGNTVHYAQLRKIHSGDGSGREGYSPAALRKTKRETILGEPDQSKVCTSFVERQNLTIRTQCKRFTRLTDAFSKTLKGLQAALSVHFWHYNFIRVHGSLKATPAMAAGIASQSLTWKEVL